MFCFYHNLLNLQYDRIYVIKKKNHNTITKWPYNYISKPTSGVYIHVSFINVSFTKKLIIENHNFYMTIGNLDS